MFDFFSIEIHGQLLVNGILFGAMYGVAAIGLSIIFGTMRIMFFAQGSMLILFAYGAFWLFKLLGIDPYLSIIIIFPLSMLFGSGLYQGLFRRVAKAEGSSLLIAFGLLVILENLMSILWSADARAIRTDYTAYGFKMLGLKVSFTRFMSLLIAIVSTLGITFYLKRTIMGKAIRATSENLFSAALVGIRPHWVNMITFALGIGLSGIAGVSIATTYAFNPFTGFVFTLKAFITMALGGVGNVAGALLGGIFLGVIESFAGFFIGGGWGDAISYTVFLFVLMVRPEGLFSLSSGKDNGALEPLKVSDIDPSQEMSKPWKMPRKIRIGLPSCLILALCCVPLLVDSEKSYIINFLFYFFIYTALSQSWNLIGGFTGQMSLGHHAFLGLGGYITALIWLNDVTGTGYYFDPVTMILSGIGPALLAVLIGLPLLSRLRGDYFALGTLGLGEILKSIFVRGGKITGGAMGLFLPSSFYESAYPYYYTAMFIALLSIAVTYLMVKSNIGLALVAVREDETAAAANGIHILKYKVVAFSVSAFFAGLCGSLLAYWLFHVYSVTFFNLNWTIYPIVMSMLGGIGSIIGPLMGAVFLTGVSEAAKIWIPEGHPVFFGLLIIIVVFFLPNGLIHLKPKTFFKRKKRRSGNRGEAPIY